MTIRVTAVDLETGDTSTADIEPGNFTVIAVAPCWVAGEQHHANGTTVLTLKGRGGPVAGMREVSVATGGATNA